MKMHWFVIIGTFIRDRHFGKSEDHQKRHCQVH
jgi:hypothetical protein